MRVGNREVNMSLGGLNLLWVLVLVFLVWVLYLLIEIARHVQAWPFG